MVSFLVLTAVTFSMFGFIIGLWADARFLAVCTTFLWWIWKTGYKLKS